MYQCIDVFWLRSWLFEVPVFSVFDRLQCYLNQLCCHMVFFLLEMNTFSLIICFFFLLVVSILSNTYLPMGFAYFLLWRLCPLYNEKRCCVKEAIKVKIWWSGHKIMYLGNPIKFICNLQNRKIYGISDKFDNFYWYAFVIKWGMVTLFVLRGACDPLPKLPIFSLNFVFLWSGCRLTW